MNHNLTTYCIVLCTCPSKAVATQIAQSAIEAKLAACINIVPQMTSIFRWKDHIECEEEVQMILKTRQNKLESLERLIHKAHPYDVPEWLAIPIMGGSAGYLNWMDSVL